MSSKIKDFTEQEISHYLAEVQDRPVEVLYPSELLGESPRPAAVLIPILRKNNAWHLLFTLRTDTLAEHSGQVSFPGGRTEPEDATPEETAKREAFEEIALNPQHLRILGKLYNLITITNYLVTPVVGVIPWPYKFQLAYEEVRKVFTIPLEWLADPSNHEIQYRTMPPHHTPFPVVYFERYKNELLWGVSAQITLNFLITLGLVGA